VVPRRTEAQILESLCMCKGHPRGLVWRVIYYCVSKFAIRGGCELYRTWCVDFGFGKDHKGEFVEYHERTSKNGKASLKRFQPEHFRLALRNYEVDVVDTFRRYYSHLPEGVESLFLSVIDNPRTCVWYSRTVMGLKSLRSTVRNMLVENGLDPDGFTNKSGRATLVTRMAEAGVPPEVGMTVTGGPAFFKLLLCIFVHGFSRNVDPSLFLDFCILYPGHMSSKSYAKYDKSKEAKIRAAQRCAAEPGLTYAEALKEETMVLAERMVDGDLEDVKQNLRHEFDSEECNPPKKLKGSCSGNLFLFEC
jgi:hypothetical protein